MVFVLLALQEEDFLQDVTPADGSGRWGTRLERADELHGTGTSVRAIRFYAAMAVGLGRMFYIGVQLEQLLTQKTDRSQIAVTHSLRQFPELAQPADNFVRVD